MLNEIVQQRMSLAGTTQAKLAEYIGTTPSQMGLFLKGSASLNNEALDKCLKALDINIDIYAQRYSKAVIASSKFRAKNIDIQQIADMSKAKMIEITQMQELRYLIDVDSQEEFDMMIKSQIVDIEATFPFFKAMVMHLCQVGDKFTPKSVEASYGKLATAITAGAAIIPMFGIATSIIASLSFLAYQKYNKEGGFLAPLFGLTEKLIKK